MEINVPGRMLRHKEEKVRVSDQKNVFGKKIETRSKSVDFPCKSLFRSWVSDGKAKRRQNSEVICCCCFVVFVVFVLFLTV